MTDLQQNTEKTNVYFVLADDARERGQHAVAADLYARGVEIQAERRAIELARLCDVVGDAEILHCMASVDRHYNAATHGG